MGSIRAFTWAPALAGLLVGFAALPARATPAGTWSEITYPAPPAARALTVAWDPALRRLYRFGGSDGRLATTDTWVLDLAGDGAWSRLAVPGDVPNPREHHALAFDAARNRLLLYGGRGLDGNVLGDVWALSLGSEPRWTRLAVPGVAPRARYGHAALLEPDRDRLVVTGGRDASGALADGWALSLDPLAWSPLAPGTAGPDARIRPTLAYDGTRHVAWTYGGIDIAGRTLEDLWSFGPGDSSGCHPLVISGDLPGPLHAHSMVYDGGRSRLVVFGGTAPDGASDRVHAISVVDRTSVRLTPAGTPPGPRYGHAWVFDSRMDRHYLIGGQDGGTMFGDVHWMDGDGRYWTALAPTGDGPGPVVFHTAVLDDSLRRILVFGGLGSSGPLGGLWALALGDAPAWSELAATGDVPPARYAHVAAFDPATRRMIVSGGTPVAGGLGDSWSLDVDSLVWHRIPRGEPNRARRSAAAAWDPDRARLLVFAGIDSVLNAVSGDLWTLDPQAGAWSMAWPLPGQPPARAWHTLVRDTRADALVMFGGNGASRFSDAWRLPLAGGGWTPLAPAGEPPAARSGHSAVYDSAGARMLVFGGDTGGARAADVWSLALEPEPAWSRLDPLAVPGGPAPRSLHGAALDATGPRMIVLEGSAGDTLRNDAWALALGVTPSWSALVPEASPPPRQPLPTVTYDPVRHRLIGLGNSLDPRQRAWEMPLDGIPEWRPLAAEGEPPPGRWGATAVYDPVRDRIVYFGGAWWITATTLNDVWALNLGGTPRWEQLLPSGTAPAPRMGHAAAYDPVRDRIIVHSGYNEPGSFTAFGDQWALELGDSLRWVQLFTGDGSYLYRVFHTLTYDPVRDRLLSFGGCEELTYGSVYEFPLGEPSLRWTKLIWANTGGPENRRSPSAVFDAPRDRIVVFGGDSDRLWGPGGTPFADVWALQLTDSVHWQPIEMTAGPSPGARGEHNAVWDPVHGRMLVFGGNDGTTDLNDLWQATWDGEPPAAVDESPRAPGLAFRSIRPHPVVGRAAVALSLPGAGPAGLDVFDVSGRRLVHRDLEPGPGARVVELDARGSLRPGIYLLRLEQGGRIARSRMVVLR